MRWSSVASDNELRLISAAISATKASKNEVQLRHELEKALEQECLARSIAWTPFSLSARSRLLSRPQNSAGVVRFSASSRDGRGTGLKHSS
jgi:hypothetical protein